MKRTVLFSAAMAFVAAVATSAQATTFFVDQFNYADGELTVYDGSGADVSGGLWSPHSGTGFPVPIFVDSGQAVVESGNPASEDANRSAGTTIALGETWYYGALVTVVDERADTATSLNNDYFMHFRGSTGGFIGRAYVDDPNVADPTKFTFGLSATSGGQVAKWTTDLDFGTQYKIMVSYAVDTGETNLWVDPVDISSTSINDTSASAMLAAIDTLALRQDFSTGGGDYQVLVDAVAIGDSFADVMTDVMIPEPASAVLALLGLAAVVGSRRRVA
ncbi:MAG: PEP-CTERM sorting domain-containing protein [Planctomycetota bacterium]